MNDIANGHGQPAPYDPPFPPPGWAEHPTSPGWYYKGKRVITEAQLRAKFTRYGFIPADDTAMTEAMAQRRQNMVGVIESAGTHHQLAIDTLAEIMTDPEASTAQVRACESIIAWAAGAPERFVQIALDIKGQTVDEAMDTVIRATMAGTCSLEAGQALMAMLRQKAEVVELGKLREEIDGLRALMSGRVISGSLR